VVPAKDFSGDIKLSVTPISTEKTPVAPGQETAQGEKIELVINVNPQADDAKLTVRDIQGKEDTLLDLGSKIGLPTWVTPQMAPSSSSCASAACPPVPPCCWAALRSASMLPAITRYL
jgi:hypothetical protein